MKNVGYFSAEIGRGRTPARMRIPTYSGGLGALSGCNVETVADMSYEEFPFDFTAVSLLYPEGYFTQRIVDGRQQEEYPRWDPEREGLTLLPNKVTIDIAGTSVEIAAWREDVRGRARVVPIHFLDTGRASGCNNNEYFSNITSRLYAGDNYQRLLQESVLGFGGVEMLEALGINVDVWHMNEGHSAFIVPALLRRLGNIQSVRERSVYTTHSPVAGHDGFDYEVISSVFNGTMPQAIRDLAGSEYLSMTQLAFNGSRHTNAVSRRHAETSKQLFGRDIAHVTNGVHTRWVSKPLQVLYDENLPGWRDDPSLLKGVRRIEKGKIAAAQLEARHYMVEYLNGRYGAGLDPDRPVLGWARRFDGSYSPDNGCTWSSYKRPELIFDDMIRLEDLMKKYDAQLILAGKAHPNNDHAKREIARVYRRIAELRGGNKNAFFVPDYDMEKCLYMTSGCDVWLYTPRPRLEACSTSGICAAMNGRGQIGVRDGWWYEGFRGDNGWVVGGLEADDQADAESLYDCIDVALSSDLTDVAYAVVEAGADFSAHNMVRNYARIYQ